MTLYQIPWHQLRRFDRRERVSIVRLLAARLRAYAGIPARVATLPTKLGTVTFSAFDTDHCDPDEFEQSPDVVIGDPA